MTLFHLPKSGSNTSKIHSKIIYTTMKKIIWLARISSKNKPEVNIQTRKKFRVSSTAALRCFGNVFSFQG